VPHRTTPDRDVANSGKERPMNGLAVVIRWAFGAFAIGGPMFLFLFMAISARAPRKERG